MLNSAGRYEIESDEESPVHPLPAIEQVEEKNASNVDTKQGIRVAQQEEQKRRK